MTRLESHRERRYSTSGTARSRWLAWAGSLLTLAFAGVLVLQWPHLSGRDSRQASSDSGSVSRVLIARGGVELRQGDFGAWTPAQSGDRLDWGDWIKSSDDGTAEIRFPDGSTFVLPPATVGRLDQLAHGSPDRDPGRPEIEGIATLDIQWLEGHDTATPGGPSRLSGPQLVSPASEHQVDLATQRQLRLAWETVPAARRYALHVSSSPSFASNIIDDAERRKPSARIGIRRPGVFYWRVAAVRSDGTLGTWSEIRSFRVTDPGWIQISRS